MSLDNEVGGSFSLDVIVPSAIPSKSLLRENIFVKVCTEKSGIPSLADTTFSLSNTVMADNIEIIHNATDMLSENGMNPRIAIMSILSALSAIPFPFKSTPKPSPFALV